MMVHAVVVVVVLNNLHRGNLIDMRMMPFKIGTPRSNSELLNVSATKIHAKINHEGPSLEIVC